MIVGKIYSLLRMLEVETLVNIGRPITQSTQVKLCAGVLKEDSHGRYKLLLSTFCFFPPGLLGICPGFLQAHGDIRAGSRNLQDISVI